MKGPGLAIVFVTVALRLYSAAPSRALTPADALLVPLLQKAKPDVAHFAVLLRRHVDEGQDLIVVLASPREILNYLGDRAWGESDVLGVFLQERSRSSQVATLSILRTTAEEQGWVRIERAAAGELVLARVPEKGRRHENVQLFFDTRSRKLIKKITYPPFNVTRIVTDKGVPNFVGGDGRQIVTVRPGSAGEEFTVLKRDDTAGIEDFHAIRFGSNQSFELVEEPGDSLGPRRVVRERPGQARSFSLPQSTYDQFKRARPRRVTDGYGPETQIREDIGPHALVEGRLWFGKTFYDGEGVSGVGGFGYFDPATRRYELYSPPEIRDWSASAILVETDAVWLALVRRGEYGDAGGGMLRWDRSTRLLQRYSIRAVVNAMARYGGAMLIATDDGIAEIGPAGVRRFMLDYTLGGVLQVVEKTL